MRVRPRPSPLLALTSHVPPPPPSTSLPAPAQVRAFEDSQRYKEGRFILEKARIVKEGPGWGAENE